jgi:uncharacterized protein with GYD domain
LFERNKTNFCEEMIMPTFIMTGTWTDQGIRGVKDAPKRAQAARDLAKKIGVEINQVFLTSGESDLLLILETSNADNIPKFALAIGSLGNLRTRTVRAWPEAEMTKFISELP